MNGNVFSGFANTEFLSEPLWQWALFLLFILCMLNVWHEVLDFMK